MKTNNTTFDIEAKAFMFILHLKEAKEKKYSAVECDKNIVYLFDNNDDFEAYFIENGIEDINRELLRLCRMKTTKNGTVIALKGLCDRTIKRYKMGKELTQSRIDEIHANGKITPAEKVREWESFGLCAPGDGNGSAAERCRKFSDCHECLVDYASLEEEHDKVELKPAVAVENVYTKVKK